TLMVPIEVFITTTGLFSPEGVFFFLAPTLSLAVVTGSLAQPAARVSVRATNSRRFIPSSPSRGCVPPVYQWIPSPGSLSKPHRGGDCKGTGTENQTAIAGRKR